MIKYLGKNYNQSDNIIHFTFDQPVPKTLWSDINDIVRKITDENYKVMPMWNRPNTSVMYSQIKLNRDISIENIEEEIKELLGQKGETREDDCVYEIKLFLDGYPRRTEKDLSLEEAIEELLEANVISEMYTEAELEERLSTIKLDDYIMLGDNMQQYRVTRKEI